MARPLTLIIAAAVAAVLAGCGGSSLSASTHAQQSFTAAQVKRAFASAGIQLAEAPSVRPSASQLPEPSAMLAALILRPRPSPVEVLVFGSSQEATRFLHPDIPSINTPRLKTVRRSNVLISWHGMENPRVAAAVSRLR